MASCSTHVYICIGVCLQLRGWIKIDVYIVEIDTRTHTRQEIDPSSDRLGTESNSCKTRKAKDLKESILVIPGIIVTNTEVRDSEALIRGFH